MKEKPIFYEPHPVTPERKRELVGAGYRIVDATFKPADYENPGEIADQRPVMRGKRKAVQDDGYS